MRPRSKARIATEPHKTVRRNRAITRLRGLQNKEMVAIPRPKSMAQKARPTMAADRAEERRRSGRGSVGSGGLDGGATAGGQEEVHVT